MSANPTNIMPLPAASLESLVDGYIESKKAEEAARTTRVQFEERILALLPAKLEGSDTTLLDNGFKVTTTGALSYKADDLNAIETLTKDWGYSVIKQKAELDATGCKWIRANRPELWAKLAKVVTVTPMKTALKVSV